MKVFIYSLIVLVLAFSVVLWLHWGGLSNDFGTLLIVLADVLFITIILDNHGKKSTDKE